MPGASPETVRVRPARPEELPELATLLAHAFRDDPFHAWLLPGARSRPREGRRLFELLLEHALRQGAVWTAEPLAGAAVWRAPRPDPLSSWQRFWLALRFTWLVGRRAWQVQEGYRRIEALHPKEPHWHLSVIGTPPEHQGRGVGSALLGATLACCDDEGVLAHLECSKDRNIPFYERHGFHVVGVVTVPGGPTLWSMTRKPCR